MAAMRRAVQYMLHGGLQEVNSITRVTPHLATGVTAAIQPSQIVRDIRVSALVAAKIPRPSISRTSPRSKLLEAHQPDPTLEDKPRQRVQRSATTPSPSRREENASSPSLLLLPLSCTRKSRLTLSGICQTPSSLLSPALPPIRRNYYTSSINSINSSSSSTEAFLANHLLPFNNDEEAARGRGPSGKYHFPPSSSKKGKKWKELLTFFPAHAHAQADDVTSACGRRPLVVFFPWRGSSAKLRAKYCLVYQRLGLDVLCLAEGMTVQVCSQPRLIEAITKHMVDILQGHPQFSGRPLLLHCMSGGYMFAGSLLVNMNSDDNSTSQPPLIPGPFHPSSTPHSANPGPFKSSSASLPANPGPFQSPDISLRPVSSDSLASKPAPNQSPLFPLSEAQQLPEHHQRDDTRSGYLKNPVLGMVLDCPVMTAENARRGIEVSVPNPVLSGLIRMSLAVFSRLHDPVYEAYGRAVVTLDKSPKLFLHSSTDDLCPVEDVRQVVSELKAQGVSVETREFPEASHVRLLGKDPEKYQREIAGFLKQLGVSVPVGNA